MSAAEAAVVRLRRRAAEELHYRGGRRRVDPARLAVVASLAPDWTGTPEELADTAEELAR